MPASGTCPPSIFNDVIGPVMRGPSSSHCAAALRIGRMARDLIGGTPRAVRVEFDANGSLATTHASQGSDMGLCGGLMGWEATDPRLPGAVRAAREAGIRVTFHIVDRGDPHPNTYRLALSGPAGRHTMIALSTGGGAIEVIAVDGFPTMMRGDCYETLLCLAQGGKEALSYLARRADIEPSLHVHKGRDQLIRVRGRHFLDERTVAALSSRCDLRHVARIAPIMPVLTMGPCNVPFLTATETLAYAGHQNMALWELAMHYEAARGQMTHAQVLERMTEIVRTMRASLEAGLRGTQYADRILGPQSLAFHEHLETGRLLDAGMLNRIVLYVSAIMEAKSAMEVIVAAPTAGSCGGLPGACLGAADAMGLGTEDVARAMLAAGLIGVFIAARATFAAEIGGCQAECGAGSGMAAAALVTLARGTARQALAAASMALQNTLGMTCDPVANRVEVPCLGKNVLAASNALACANMALADYDPVVPLDQVIETMDRVGKSLPAELRCTALGGLSTTPASRAWERRLAATADRQEGSCCT